MKVKSQSEVAQSCPTASDPMDCSLLGSSVHGIFQARVLEWDAIAFSERLHKISQIIILFEIIISIINRNILWLNKLLFTSFDRDTWFSDYSFSSLVLINSFQLKIFALCSNLLSMK